MNVKRALTTVMIMLTENTLGSSTRTCRDVYTGDVRIFSEYCHQVAAAVAAVAALAAAVYLLHTAVVVESSSSSSSSSSNTLVIAVAVVVVIIRHLHNLSTDIQRCSSSSSRFIVRSIKYTRTK